MWFLIDSHTYFEERSEVPFFEGLVAVFMNGGITFLTTLMAIIWMSRKGRETIFIALETIGLGLFLYAFISSFFTWFLMGVFFYIFIFWEGETKVEFFPTISMAGLGFVPLMFGSIVELLATTYYAYTVPPAEITTTHVLISGAFGIVPAIVMMIIHVFVILWACHIWNGGVHQLGGVSPRKSMIVVLSIGSILVFELIILSLL